MIAQQRTLVAEPDAAGPEGSTFGFRCLVFFTFVVFVAPQNIYGFLEPLHLAKVSMLLAIGAYVQNRLTLGQSLMPSGTEYRLLWLFSFCVVLSIPTSIWPGGSLGLVKDLYVKSLIVCILTAQLLSDTEKMKRMLGWILCFCLVVSVHALLGYQRGEVVAGYRMQGTAAGISANPNDFALTLNLFIPYALLFFMLTRRLLSKIFLAGFVLVAVGAILLTFSRGGFVTLVAVLGLALWKTGRQGRIAQIMIPAVLGLAALVLLAPEGYSERIASILDSSKDTSGSSAARWAAVTAALELVAERPLTGVGAGMNVVALVDKGLFWDHVHNVYLQIASEVGLPALVVYLLLLFQLIRGLRSVQQSFEDDEGSRELVCLAQATEISILAFAIAAMLHPVAYHFYFFYLAGFALAIKAIAERRLAETHESAPAFDQEISVHQSSLARSS